MRRHDALCSCASTKRNCGRYQVSRENYPVDAREGGARAVGIERYARMQRCWERPFTYLFNLTYALLLRAA
jgi:hypothetical protein